jgi:hypothetical protein
MPIAYVIRLILYLDSQQAFHTKGPTFFETLMSQKCMEEKIETICIPCKCLEMGTRRIDYHI